MASEMIGSNTMCTARVSAPAEQMHDTYTPVCQEHGCIRCGGCVGWLAPTLRLQLIPQEAHKAAPELKWKLLCSCSIPDPQLLQLLLQMVPHAELVAAGVAADRLQGQLPSLHTRPAHSDMMRSFSG